MHVVQQCGQAAVHHAAAARRASPRGEQDVQHHRSAGNIVMCRCRVSVGKDQMVDGIKVDGLHAGRAVERRGVGRWTRRRAADVGRRRGGGGACVEPRDSCLALAAHCATLRGRLNAWSSLQREHACVWAARCSPAPCSRVHNVPALTSVHRRWRGGHQASGGEHGHAGGLHTAARQCPLPRQKRRSS